MKHIYNKAGFDRKGIHFATGTKYNKKGFNKYGFNKEGIHCSTGTKFDSHGFDKYSFDSEGYDNTGFNMKGYNRNGFDKKGFNNEGYNRAGIDRNGFDKDGWNRKGINREGYDKKGFNSKGINNITGTKYDKLGFNIKGYDVDGYDKYGFDKNGFDRKGVTKYGTTKAKVNFTSKVLNVAPESKPSSEIKNDPKNQSPSKIKVHQTIRLEDIENRSRKKSRGIIAPKNSKKYTEPVKEINVKSTTKETVIKARVGHSQFKENLLSLGNKCLICGLSGKEFLIGSHIKPWSASGDIEKLDHHNGLLLCHNHDNLFDRGYISFEDTGKIIISNQLAEENTKILGISEDIKVKLTQGNIRYLKYHRENILRK